MLLAAQDGQPALAATWSIQAIEQWEMAGNMRQACLDRINLSQNLRKLGLYKESIQASQQSLEQAQRLGIEHAIGGSRMLLALALAQQGQIHEAEQFIPIASSDSVRMQIFSREGRAWFALYASRPTDALSESNNLLELTAGNPEPNRNLAHGLTIRARALLDLGRCDEAVAAARTAMGLLESVGSLETGESLLRLTYAEALYTTGAGAQARQAITAAHAQVLRRADQIENPAWRRSFLEQVAENRRIVTLARAWHFEGQDSEQV